VSSQNQIAKSDATNHEESDESHNSSIIMEEKTETVIKHDSEKEKTQELIISLLQRSVKLKFDTDIALD